MLVKPDGLVTFIIPSIRLITASQVGRLKLKSQSELCLDLLPYL